MSGKKKRGVSKCKKKFLHPGDFKVEFNVNGIAIGHNAAKFMSWIGVEVRKKIPYDKVAKDVDSRRYDDIWEYAKEKGQKARSSAKKNIDPARVGRGGFSGLEPKVPSRWDQLVTSYPHLATLQSDHSRTYAVSRAFHKPVTKLYEIGPDKQSDGELKGTLKDLYAKEKEMREDGSYYYSTKNVVIEVLGKGRQHGGRTRLFSDVIGLTKSLYSELKRKKTKSEVVKTMIAESPRICGSTNVCSNSYDDILKIKDKMMRELHLQGKTIDDIKEVLNRVPIHPRIVPTIKAAHALGCDLWVVSDANTFFIETVLQHLGVLECFSEINTNPGFVDDEGRWFEKKGYEGDLWRFALAESVYLFCPRERGGKVFIVLHFDKIQRGLMR